MGPHEGADDQPARRGAAFEIIPERTFAITVVANSGTGLLVVLASMTPPSAGLLSRCSQHLDPVFGGDSGYEQAQAKLGCIESDEVAVSFGPPA